MIILRILTMIFGVAFSAIASAHCEPRQISGVWNVTAVTGYIH
jgi:hypothetical protein